MAISDRVWFDYARIFFVELAYWVVSMSMVFVNEHVLNDKILTDDLTIFITIFQILFSLSILLAFGYVTKRFLIGTSKRCDTPASDNLTCKDQTSKFNYNLLDQHKKQETISTAINSTTLPTCNIIENHRKLSNQNGAWIDLVAIDIPNRINIKTLKLVFPLSTLYIGMLLLNNFCLKYVGVAFYFVGRSLTTVFNVAFTYLLINEPVSRKSLICCALIVIGFIVGLDQESLLGDLSVIGVLFGIASSLFTSLFSIYTKKTLMKLDKNIWALVLYNNINAIMLCSPLLVIHGDIQALVSDKVISPTFWYLLSISGVMAFFISIVTNASIKYTSPLTHNISGTAKACFQTVIAVAYYKNQKPFLWWLSNVIILLASAAYARIRQIEMDSKKVSDSSVRYTPLDQDELRKRSNSQSSDSTNSDILFDQSDLDNACSIKLNT